MEKEKTKGDGKSQRKERSKGSDKKSLGAAGALVEAGGKGRSV